MPEEPPRDDAPVPSADRIHEQLGAPQQEGVKSKEDALTACVEEQSEYLNALSKAALCVSASLHMYHCSSCTRMRNLNVFRWLSGSHPRPNHNLIYDLNPTLRP